MAVYTGVPEPKNDLVVFFLPSTGYMDHTGIFGLDKSAGKDSPGMFEEWKSVLNKKGYTTIQFDKPGVGISTGQLCGNEELTLICIFEVIESLVQGFTGKYYIFTVAGGTQFFKYAQQALLRLNKNNPPVGLIDISGLNSWHPPKRQHHVSILSVLADSMLKSSTMRKIKLEGEIHGDTLSRAVLIKGVDESFCHRSESLQAGRCKYSSELFDVVLTWMRDTWENYAPYVEDIEINLVNSDSAVDSSAEDTPGTGIDSAGTDSAQSLSEGPEVFQKDSSSAEKNVLVKPERDSVSDSVSDNVSDNVSDSVSDSVSNTVISTDTSAASPNDKSGRSQLADTVNFPDTLAEAEESGPENNATQGDSAIVAKIPSDSVSDTRADSTSSVSEDVQGQTKEEKVPNFWGRFFKTLGF